MTNINRITPINRGEINLEKYNSLINRSPDVSVYCESWYLDAVCENWFCLVLNDYEAVLPVPFTVKLGQSIVYQPFFSRELGVFSKVKLTNDLYNLFITNIPESYKKVDFNLGVELEGVVSLRKEKIMHQYLDLTKDVKNNYSSNTKRLIKKSLKNNCELEDGESASGFISFFKANTGSKVNYSSEHYINLERLILKGLALGKVSLILVKKEDSIIAQGVFLIQKHRVTYLKGSANEEGKKLGAMFFLIDSVITAYSEKVSIFDFGGSRVESIAQFYKKFGAKDRCYFNYSKNDLNWWLKKGKKVRDLLKK